jgi:tetratricopeptide (TPR) repeat protein
MSEQSGALTKAFELNRRGRFAEVEQVCREILATEPHHFEARHLLGVSFLQRGQLIRAQEHLGLALKINPGSAVALSNRGVALNGLDRFAEALAFHDKAIAINPNFPEAFNNRGAALYSLRRFSESLESYDRAIALKPAYAEAFNNRGNALRRLKRFEEAIESFDRALALKPDYVEPTVHRRLVLADIKRRDQKPKPVSPLPKVFLVAENAPQPILAAEIVMSYCVTTPTQVNSILLMLDVAGFETDVISDLRRLGELRVTTDAPFLIFPHWHSGLHRNRRTTVTGLCEAFGLPFIGADSYLRAICGDKQLSKMLAREYGFRTPQALRVRGINDRRYWSGFPFPAIVKPNYLGGSIGIDNSNVAKAAADARQIVARLTEEKYADIVIEQYIRGREVTVCCFHDLDGEIRSCAGERYVLDDPDYFIGNVYDSSWKFDRKTLNTDVRPHEAPPRSVAKAIQDFMTAECPGSYCRFDFRVNDDGWHLMEITPDPLLHPSSEFFLTLTKNDFDVQDVMTAIVLQAWNQRARS